MSSLKIGFIKSIDTIDDIVLSEFCEEVDEDKIEVVQPQVLYHKAGYLGFRNPRLYKEQ